MLAKHAIAFEAPPPTATHQCKPSLSLTHSLSPRPEHFFPGHRRVSSITRDRPSITRLPSPRLVRAREIRQTNKLLLSVPLFSDLFSINHTFRSIYTTGVNLPLKKLLSSGIIYFSFFLFILPSNLLKGLLQFRSYQFQDFF